MVGLHNLYWYYGSQTYKVKDGGMKGEAGVKGDGSVDRLVHSSEAFQG